MPRVTFFEDCVSRKVIFFAGKGGVGKSSLAWATALALAKSGRTTLLAGWRPFEAAQSAPYPEHSLVSFIPIEPYAAFREYALRILKFNRIYKFVFEHKVFKTFVRAAPGLSETVVAGKIWDLYDRRVASTILVDLPSSGHALSFFQSPLGVEKIFPAGFVHKETMKIVDMFKSKDTQIDLVSLPEELPLRETIQLKEKLECLLPLHFGYVLLNQTIPLLDVPEGGASNSLYGRYGFEKKQAEESKKRLEKTGLPVVRIPRLPTSSWLQVVEALAELVPKL